MAAEQVEQRHSIAWQLRKRREDVGLSQVELAHLAQVHRGTVRNVEQGKPLELRTLANISRSLGCAPALIYEDTHDDVGSILPLLSAGSTRAVTAALVRLGQDLQDDKRGRELWHRNVRSFYELVDAIAEARSGRRDSRAELPPSFESFRGPLPMTRQELVAFDRELHRIFGIKYPYRNTQATGYGGGTSSAYATKIAADDAAHQVDGTTGVDVVPQIEPARGEAHFRMGIGLGAATELSPITGEGHAVEADDRMAGSGTVAHPRPEIRSILASGLPESVKGDLIEYAILRRHRYEMQLTDEVLRMIGNLQSQLEREKDDGDDDG